MIGRVGTLTECTEIHAPRVRFPGWKILALASRERCFPVRANADSSLSDLTRSVCGEGPEVHAIITSSCR